MICILFLQFLECEAMTIFKKDGVVVQIYENLSLHVGISSDLSWLSQKVPNQRPVDGKGLILSYKMDLDRTFSVIAASQV